MLDLLKRATKTAASLAIGAGLLVGCGNSAGHLPAASVATTLGALGQTQAPGELSLIVLPDMGVSSLVAAIQGAQHSIKLEMYMLTASGAAGQLLQALIQRRQAGVAVQVMLETQPYMPAQAPKCQVGTFNPNSTALAALVAGGVVVKYTSPRFKYTHAKAMVIDGATAYIMSANMTNAAFTINRDYIVVDRNAQEVADVGRVFDADWVGAAYTPRSRNLVVSPVNSRARLLALIDSARQALVIQTEFFSDPEVARHLQARVKAGVDITVMCSYQTVDRCSGDDINADERKQLNDVGVTKVAFIRNVTMHAKAIVADGVRAYVGSENLGANSLDNNREMGIITEDPTVVATLHKVALSDWAGQAGSVTPPQNADLAEWPE